MSRSLTTPSPHHLVSRRLPRRRLLRDAMGLLVSACAVEALALPDSASAPIDATAAGAPGEAASSRARGEAASWLARGEAALGEGRPSEAIGHFERAARLDDERPDAELGQVRAWLQAGDHAHALAWARLVAGEHPGFPVAAAWASDLEALARGPASPLSTRTGPASVVDRESVSSDTRLPYPTFPAPPARRPRDASPQARFRRVAIGLVDATTSRLMLSPAQRAALDGSTEGQRLWVADGTGALMRLGADHASLVADDAAAEAPPGLRERPHALTIGTAVAGRPVAVLDAGLVATKSPTQAVACAVSWPRLRLGVLGWPAPGSTRLRLELGGEPPADGSTVWDACGAWLGWLQDGSLVTPAAGASTTAGASCAARTPMDTGTHYGRWYAAVASVWRED